MAEKLNEVRHRWFHPEDLKKLEEKMKAYGFTTSWHRLPAPDVSLSHERLEELEVKADTLTVHASKYMAVMPQREPASLTERDLYLRKLMKEEYNHSRPSSDRHQLEPCWKCCRRRPLKGSICGVVLASIRLWDTFQGDYPYLVDRKTLDLDEVSGEGA